MKIVCSNGFRGVLCLFESKSSTTKRIMRKFLSVSAALATLFSAIFVSCDDKENYTPCRIEIAAEGCGRVQFEGYHGYAQNYNPGNEVVVIAHPDEGYSFEGWYTKDPDALVSTERRYSFTVDGNLLLTARFVYESYSISISSTSGGCVCFENEAETSLTLPCGKEVTAIAKAEDGYTFIGWYKKSSSTPVSPQPSYSFKASENLDLIAKFDKKQFVDGYEYIDLELPSGTLWATYNVGATLPEENGGYYAWGETEEKSEYTWSTYKWCNGSNNTITKYCTGSIHGTVDNKRVLEAEDDVAQTKWGGSWRIPTANEQQELIDNCIWNKGKLNGSEGFWATSKSNGKSIFLPAAGCKEGKENNYCGIFGYYWSGATDNNSAAECIRFYNDHINIEGSERFIGHTVRPVCH